MAKKGGTKKTAKKMPSGRNLQVEKALIENFVSLQKVMVNLSTKFDNLTSQISKLLELFEISAKSLAEKDIDVEKNTKDNAMIIEKIDSILEQNKTLARGLTLVHDKISVQPGAPRQPFPLKVPGQQSQRLPFKPIQRPMTMEKETEEYHRSISSEEQSL